MIYFIVNYSSRLLLFEKCQKPIGQKDLWIYGSICDIILTDQLTKLKWSLVGLEQEERKWRKERNWGGKEELVLSRENNRSEWENRILMSNSFSNSSLGIQNLVHNNS